MSRTDLDPGTLARSLRSMAGDGSIEWVCEPMQTRVLLDVADALDESASLRERNTTQAQTIQSYRDESREWREVAERAQAENEQLRELVSFVLRFETMTDGCGDTCPYVCLNCKNECYFRKVAGELGIEVSE